MALSLSRRALIALSAGISSVALLGGTAIGYNVYYADRILPGVTVMGKEITATTAEELRHDLNARVEQAQVTLTVDGKKHVASLQDLGIKVDVDAAVNAAMAPSSSFTGRMSTPFSGHDVTITHTVNEEKLRDYAHTLIPESQTRMRNASVSFDGQSKSFVVSAAESGKTITVDDVRKAATDAAAQLAPVSADVTLVKEDPQVSTASAQSFADSANKMLATEIELTDGIDVFTASVEDKVAWINVPGQGQPYSTPRVNSAKLVDWVKATAKKTDVEPVAGVNNVNSRGDVVSVHEAGTTGWTTTNADAVAKEVETAFTSMSNYAGTFEYDKAEPPMTTRLIADGNKTHIYAATPGEKWIDIDLSENTVSAYEGGTIVYGPVYMVPGAPETPTVTGTFRVWHQNPLQTMRGLNADGTKYETPNVPWATYFYKDFALHGAPWRSSFGWSGHGGSHGCVNMPVDGAQWFYEWANIGTVVVSHY